MRIQKELSEQDTVAIIQEEARTGAIGAAIGLQTHLYIAGDSDSSVSLFILSERSALTQVKQQEKVQG